MVRDVDLRDAIKRIALRFPPTGGPRITAELKRKGWAVNHKRLRRILSQNNPLCVRKLQFVATTDSEHDFRVYPNLAWHRQPTVVNQLWVADFTLHPVC